MERFLLKVYRRYTPKSVKQLISPEMKDWLLGSLIYFVSRPGLTSLRMRHSALTATRRKDWREAVERWQEFLAVTDLRAKSEHKAGEAGAEDSLRQSKYARNELRKARLHLAAELHQQGKTRAFCELTSRIIESIPDQRVFKNNRQIVDVVRTYVQDALVSDNALPAFDFSDDDRPIKIAICLDVLKISDVHTHARVVFTMCRNLMALDSRIETHIIITNERFAVTTPVVSASFNTNRQDVVYALARAAFPKDYNSRFFLHIYNGIGLEGLVHSCKSIISINPDILLFGGGHKGLFSNESRVIRHCLYDYFTTAFFYIQSNNEVDEKIDMIIARGPHAIEGDLGNAVVRVQPYPTIDAKNFASFGSASDTSKMDNKIIVSAITGVRMDVRMEEQSSSNMKLFFSILDQNPGAVWHFIGSADPKALVANNPQIRKRVNSGQVVVHPVLPFDDFTRFVGKASLFLHLPGFTGGSGGASVARRAGIPILTFRHSDVSGRQPKETIFQEKNVAGWAKMASNLLQDREKWAEIVALQFAHTKWINNTSAKGFYDCLTDAVRIGRKRIKSDIEPGLQENSDMAGAKRLGTR